RHVRVLKDRGDAVVRELIGRVGEALRRLRIEAIAHGLRVRAAGRIAHVERNRRAVGRKSRLEADRGLGAVPALADFLFARPDQLDRLANRLGDCDGLGDLVRTQPPPETAARKRVVDVDVLSLYAGRLRRKGQRQIGVLRADPDVDAIALYVRDGIERLHWRVRNDRHVVGRLDHLGGR